MKIEGTLNSNDLTSQGFAPDTSGQAEIIITKKQNTNAYCTLETELNGDWRVCEALIQGRNITFMSMNNSYRLRLTTNANLDEVIHYKVCD